MIDRTFMRDPPQGRKGPREDRRQPSRNVRGERIRLKSKRSSLRGANQLLLLRAHDDQTEGVGSLTPDLWADRPAERGETPVRPAAPRGVRPGSRSGG